MPFLDTVLFNDNDVRALSNTHVWKIQHRAPGVRRGDHERVGGRNGAIPSRRPLEIFTVVVLMRVSGATRGERNDHFASVVSLLGGGVNGIGTLKRRIATGSGSSYVEHHASGMFVGGFDMSPDNDMSGTCELHFDNLSGCWLSGAGAVLLG